MVIFHSFFVCLPGRVSLPYHAISQDGLNANIWGILMVKVNIYIAFMDPMGMVSLITIWPQNGMSTLKLLEDRHPAALGRWPRQGPGAHQPAGCLVPFLKGDVKSKGKGKIPQFLMVKYMIFIGWLHLITLRSIFFGSSSQTTWLLPVPLRSHSGHGFEICLFTRSILVCGFNSTC